MITKKQADLAYEQGRPLMSDEEYDSKFKSDTGKILPKNTPWKKFNHPNKMASLSKVEVITAENKVDLINFKKWLSTHLSKSYVITLKYDGTAIKLYYNGGRLVRAATRGDGTTGEDVTRNIMKADNVLLEISDKYVTEIIGEVIIQKSTYKEHLSKEYSNSRNGAAGALKDFEGRNAKYLSIRYHGLNTEDVAVDTEQKKFKLLKSLGFKHITYSICTDFAELESFYHTTHTTRKDLDFEVDGCVIKVNQLSEQEELGFEPSGNPKFACAIKFPYARKVTRVKKILWSMGNAGALTPIAVIRAVDLGVTVKRASLANVDRVKELQISVGDKVVISRRGDVIPYVEKNCTKHKNWKIELPQKCPVCKEKPIIDGPLLVCSNVDCDSRKLGDLHKWSNKIKDHFKVKGLGEERVEQMFRAKLVQTPADLYRVTEEQLVSSEHLTGVKEAAAKNILDFQKHTKIPLDVFLGGLNIPSIGQSIFGFLIQAGYDSLEKIQKISRYELAAIQNLGEIRARVILIWLKKKKSIIDDLLKYIEIEKPKQAASDKLKGKSFCITGKLTKSRSFYEDLIKDAGGKVSGVSGALTYLIVGEEPGSKLAKAQKLGIKILNETQLSEVLSAS